MTVRAPLQIKRGLLTVLQTLGLRPGEPAVAWDDPAEPRLVVGDRNGWPREVVPASHTHAIGDTSGLQQALDAKSGLGHGHTSGEITGLSSALSALEHHLQTLTLEVTTSGTLDLGLNAILSAISSTQPGRFRLYRDEISRDSDAGRLVQDDPAPGSGCLLEVVFTAEGLTILLSPLVLAAPSSTLCAWSWEGAGATVSLAALVLEAA